jgi:hypothetical protein
MIIELHRGTANDIVTRAERAGGKGGWVSVAYFKLGMQPTRVIFGALEPYSRTPSAAPFDDGDELIVVGRISKRTGLLSAICTRMVRQGKTLDDSPKALLVLGGLALSAIGFYPVAKILIAIYDAPTGSADSVLSHDGSLVIFGVMMIAGGMTGLLLLATALLNIKARRMLDWAISRTD